MQEGVGVRVPTTLQATIAARIDRSYPKAKRTLMPPSRQRRVGLAGSSENGIVYEHVAYRGLSTSW
jgi:hypothetical protein